MKSRDFCYWLQGFFEVSDIRLQGTCELNQEQVKCIRNHLNMVFKHEIDPSMGDSEHQGKLTALHEGHLGLTNPGGTGQRLTAEETQLEFPFINHGHFDNTKARC